MKTDVSTSEASKGRSWLRLDIQGLRALAVLLVVTFHSGLPVPGGFIGVDVFFVISGYVITELILRNQATPGGFRLRTFYARRMKRLLPALALMTTITLIVSIFLLSPFGPQKIAALTGIGASFFVANFAIYANTGGYFDAPAEANPLLHTWSLSVEEQFYFGFPALMILAATLSTVRMFSARRAALLLVALVASVSFALSIAFGFDIWQPSWLESPSSWAFYSSVTRAWEFSVGALLALGLSHGSHLLRPYLARVLGWIGLLTIAASAAFITQDMVFPGLVALAPVLGTAAIIAAGTTENRDGVTRGLSTKTLVWIGGLSYSWYLWHWPIIVFANQLFPDNVVALIAAGALSLLPAWLAFRLVENPIRTSPRIHGSRAAVVIALSIAIPAASGFLVFEGAQRSWNNQAIVDMSRQITPVPVSYTRGCDFGTPLGQQQSLDCTWNPDDSGAPIFLVGDSQAAQFAEALIGAGQSLNRPVTIATEGSCPFITTEGGEAPLSSPQCNSFVSQSLEWLTEQAPATVLIGMSGNYVTGDYAADIENRLVRSVDILESTGHEVLLFQAIPQFPQWSPFDCTLFDVMSDPQGCGATVAEQEMDSRQQLALTLFADVSDLTGAHLVDFRSELRVAGEYATNQGNTWNYRDMFHISVTKSEKLRDSMLSALEGDR